jgi:multiple antibiotic resistance protein
MARKASLTCFIVLTGFALGGQLIFRMFGITLPAFEIAGGLILLLIGLDMLEAKRSPTQEASGDTEEASHKEDAGIVPLGIPMLAGPGAISSVMVLVGQVPTLWNWEMGAILGSIALTSLISYWVLAGASRVRRVMGETGIRILVRIMGLLLVALAMQFFVNGLTDLGVISKQ